MTAKRAWVTNITLATGWMVRGSNCGRSRGLSLSKTIHIGPGAQPPPQMGTVALFQG